MALFGKEKCGFFCCESGPFLKGELSFRFYNELLRFYPNFEDHP